MLSEKEEREPFTYNKSNKEEIDSLLNRPDLGIGMAVSGKWFSSTLPHVRSGENVYYHPNHFFIRLDYNMLWLRAGVKVANGGWCWENEIYSPYEPLGIKTVEDLLRVLGQYIPAIKLISMP